jgi:hypothetical protein
MVPVFAGLLGDGTPVAWGPEPAGEAVEGFQRESAILLRFRGDGTLDTLGHFAGRETIMRRRDLGGGTMAIAGYFWGFYRTFLAVAAGDRIYAGSTDSAVIHVWDGADTPLPSLRWGDVPRPLDDHAIDAR